MWDQDRVREPAGGDAGASTATRGRQRKREVETKEQREGVRGAPTLLDWGYPRRRQTRSPCRKQCLQGNHALY